MRRADNLATSWSPKVLSSPVKFYIVQVQYKVKLGATFFRPEEKNLVIKAGMSLICFFFVTWRQV